MKKILLGIFFLTVLFGISFFPEVNRRLNSITSEISIPVSSLSNGSFRFLGSLTVDGPVYGSPIYVKNITISGQIYNIVIVTTMNGSAYAFDSKALGGYLWTVRLTSSPRTSYPNMAHFYSGSLGCLATPVIDIETNYGYFLCTNTTPTWKLYKVDITTGSISNSVDITGSVSGIGDSGHSDTVSGGVLSFYPSQELGRAGLTLANGKIYVAFGAQDDSRPWHGWIFSYDKISLSQTNILCLTPNSYGGGVWQSSGGIAGGLPVDSSGNLYVTTGNGDYDGITEFGDSVVKLSPSLSIIDWYTPNNQSTLESEDADVSSGRPMLIPRTNLVVFGLKDFNIYSVNTQCMGHLAGTIGGCSAPQIFASGSGSVTSSSGIYGGMFLNGVGYFPNTGGKIYSFSLSGSTWNTTALASTSSIFSFPGAAQMIGTCTQTSDCEIWAVTFSSSAYSSMPSGTLRAFNSTTLAEYWNSDTTGGPDVLGHGAKFASPLLANQKIFVSTLDNKVQVYGLLPSSKLEGNSKISGSVVIH